MQDTESVNERATLKRPTVGFRLREDLHPLLKSAAKRRGFDHPAAMMENAALAILEDEFPGSTGRAVA